MDFIHRAGSLLDKSHMLVGFFALIIIAETLVILSLAGENAEMARTNNQLAIRREVYVVPNSQAGLYAPRADRLLLESFAEFVVQSLNTYTYENLPAQYNEVKNFFTPALITRRGDSFQKLLKDVKSLGRSQIFIPDPNAFRMQVKKENGREIILVNIGGQAETILAGRVVTSAPTEIQLRMKRALFSPTNPFGLMLDDYIPRPLTTRKE